MRGSYAYLAALLALGWAAAARAGPAGGGFHVPASGMTAGGGAAPSGGGFRLAGSVGVASAVQLTGGGFTMRPGIVASQRPSAADLSGAHAFPVPFIPSQGHSHITFTALTARLTIRVYTLSGELVKTLIKDSATTDTLVWSPVVNEDSEPLASGVYLYYMKTSDGTAASGKLMVIK